MLSCPSALEFRSFPKTAKQPRDERERFATYLNINTLLFIQFWDFAFSLTGGTMRVERLALSTTWVVNRNSPCDSHRKKFHGSIPIEQRCGDHIVKFVLLCLFVDNTKPSVFSFRYMYLNCFTCFSSLLIVIAWFLTCSRLGGIDKPQATNP